MTKKTNEELYAVPVQPTGDFPRYFLAQYDGDVEEMVNDLYARVYWMKVLGLKYKDADGVHERPTETSANDWLAEVYGNSSATSRREMQYRLCAESYAEALSCAEGIESKAGRSFVRILEMIQTHGLWQQGEHETLEQFLLDRFPRLEHQKSEKSDILFLVNDMLPLISAISDEPIMNSKEHYSKIRASVPYMRAAYAEFNENVKTAFTRVEDVKELKQEAERKKTISSKASPEYKKAVEEIQSLEMVLKTVEKDAEIVKETASKKLLEKVNDTLEKIHDPSVGTDGPNSIRELLKRGGKKVHFKAFKAMAPEVIVFHIKVPQRFESTIEKALQFIEFQATDPAVIERALEEIFHTKGKK